jgi:Uma2 family endonuclease
MALPQSKFVYTVEQYLEFERQSEERHQFIDGEIYEMAGETLAHSQISFNFGANLGPQLRGTPCQGLSPNMKIRTGPYIKGARNTKGLFSYADLIVVCGQPLFHDEHRDVLLNPTVIVEVLSPSTQSFDRGDKFRRYSIWNESLHDYVMAWQTRPRLEHYQRQPGGKWLIEVIEGLESTLGLESIACELRLSDLYDRVEFPIEELPEEEPLVSRGSPSSY